jgi:hypothetical protein
MKFVKHFKGDASYKSLGTSGIACCTAQDNFRMAAVSQPTEYELLDQLKSSGRSEFQGPN